MTKTEIAAYIARHSFYSGGKRLMNVESVHLLLNQIKTGGKESKEEQVGRLLSKREKELEEKSREDKSVFKIGHIPQNEGLGRVLDNKAKVELRAAVLNADAGNMSDFGKGMEMIWKNANGTWNWVDMHAILMDLPVNVEVSIKEAYKSIDITGQYGYMKYHNYMGLCRRAGYIKYDRENMTVLKAIPSNLTTSKLQKEMKLNEEIKMIA